MDSQFDFAGFWVGECALDTLMPYWRKAAVVSASSQFTHILWAEATFEQGERMSGDSMVQHCCVAATIHHFCDIGVKRKVLHVPTVGNSIKGLRAAPAGGAFQETLCVVSELADMSPGDEPQYAFDTFSWYRHLYQESQQVLTPQTLESMRLNNDTYVARGSIDSRGAS